MIKKKEKKKEIVEIKVSREIVKVARYLIFSKKSKKIIGCIIMYSLHLRQKSMKLRPNSN